MDTGRVLRTARQRAGLTQSALAARLGTSQSVVVRWERGQRSPSMATIERFLRACGFRARLEVDPVDPDTQKQIALQLALSPQERLEAHDRAVRSIEPLRGIARDRAR